MAVRVDRKKDLGILECKVCGQSFQTSISCEWSYAWPNRLIDADDRWPSDLTLPVDVYADWVDACEAVARPRPSRVPASPSMPAMAREAEGMSTEVDIRMSIEDHDEALSMI